MQCSSLEVPLKVGVFETFLPDNIHRVPVVRGFSVSALGACQFVHNSLQSGGDLKHSLRPQSIYNDTHVDLIFLLYLHDSARRTRPRRQLSLRHTTAAHPLQARPWSRRTVTIYENGSRYFAIDISEFVLVAGLPEWS